MTENAIKIIFFMTKQLSTFSHGYKENVEGAYDAAINNYGYEAPIEGKDKIVNKVLEILVRLDKDI